ncbi:CoA transferase subunit A [Sodalis ligni]|uniref:Glutaconate CoA-transferase subunit A n=1 Tax=Sodalis ligni TaxID=2697027 RepID=A0A4R1NGG5_9GAMM|nr:CoA-transferase [Sodalis ligni]TCL06785.1 glutaconate CoA-transferase subunit A [Sodalis ligni]
MKSKRLALPDAIARIPSGSTIALGGSLLRRQPMAIVHEIIRQRITDLTLLTWATTLATDMLAAAGSIRRWEGIYAGFFRHGLAPNFRRGVESGRIETHDYSESAFVARFRAAGMGLSFLPSKALLGTGMPGKSPDEVKPITCPFTGDTYLALKAAEADFTLLHGYTADEYGNVQWPVVRDSDDIDQMMASASRRLIVTVEKIIPHEQVRRRPALTYIPHTLVEAVVEMPYGAHPTATDGFYNEDEAALKAYLAAAKQPGGTAAYIREYILNTRDRDGYLAKFGTLSALHAFDVERESQAHVL